MKNSVIFLVAFCLLGASSATLSAEIKVPDATVMKILVDSKKFGGCMISLDKVLADFGLNCDSKWVTFACDGTYGAKDIAFRQLDQAQMAMALDKKVNLLVDDSKNLDGYCYASRIAIY
jgi:hypothetical protein